MSITPTTLLFLDAASLFAAAVSPTGGSGFILEVCQRGFLRAATSQSVLIETERSILAKRPAALSTYRLQLTTTPVTLVSVPPQRVVARYEPEFLEDAHVIAAALAAHADFLITLDRPFIGRVQAAKLSIAAMTPKEFLEHVLPTHAAYSEIR